MCVYRRKRLNETDRGRGSVREKTTLYIFVALSRRLFSTSTPVLIFVGDKKVYFVAKSEGCWYVAERKIETKRDHFSSF